MKCVRQLSCVSQDIEPPESTTISGKGKRVLEPIRRVRFTRAALHQANIQDNTLPSQLQEIQDQINSLDDAGEFQEVESNHMEHIWITGKRFR